MTTQTQEKSQERILLVDDDSEIRGMLSTYLSQNGFGVRAVATAAEMKRLLERESFSALVLDLMLPDGDGLQICAVLRADKIYLPIMMLTAKGQEIDRILGIEVGADDYLSKPFSPRELLARLRALLRRRDYAVVPGTPEAKATIFVADWRFDASSRMLTRGDIEHLLTTGEFALLNALVSNPLRPIGRERLAELSRTREGEVNDSFRSVDVQIARLRKLIEPNPKEPRYLQTVWGFGYVFVPNGQSR
jgi:two-component system, OmpR family, phosphate regulon response regulator OmpR